MRAPAATIALCLVAGCTSTELDGPSVRVSPYLAVYQLRGRTRFDSPGANPGDPPVANTQQRLATYGQDRYREDFGIRADIGDDFSGVRLDYYRLDMGTTRFGEPSSGWGLLPDDQRARMLANMDEFRTSWVERVLDVRTKLRNKPLRVRLGAGAVLAYRELKLRGRTQDGSVSQDLSMQGMPVYGAARARADWQNFAFDLEYALSPGTALGGDFKDAMQDIEARLSYRLSQRDITFFAGFRYSNLLASGSVRGQQYDADLAIDGFQFGASVTF